MTLPGLYKSHNRRPGIPAAQRCYEAFCSFRGACSDTRQRCFGLALRIPTGPGLNIALRHDARMGAEVTEIVRRIFNEEFR